MQPASARCFSGLKSEPRCENDESGPEDVGAEKVDGLKPDWSEQDDVEYTQHVLERQENKDRGGEAAVVPVGGATGCADKYPN
jgi:hypothetical protein